MRNNATRIARRTSLWYGLIAGLWILLSDRFLALFFPEWNQIIRLQTYKGWAFVALTTLLLFVILRRQLLAREQEFLRRRQTEESLAASEAELRALFASMQDVVLALDHSGVYRKIAPTNPGLLSRSPEDLLGKTLWDVFPPEQADAFLATIQQVLQTRQTRRIKYQLTVRDRLVWFETAVTPMTQEQTLWVARDVTAEHQTQVQLQRQERLAAIGQVAAGIAHDFNNIMAVITVYAQMLAQSPELTERNQKRIHTIEQQALHASRMIQQILDFSRKAVLSRQPLDLLPLLKEEVDLLRRTLPEYIEIDLTCETEPLLVQADPTRMRQVIMNLAVNARDAMPDGGTLSFTLASYRLTAVPPLSDMLPGDYARLTVTDTGSGIPVEVLSRIFEPFFTTKASGGGTGLGLAQVYGIVGQHGGQIDVSSYPGKGTTFTIYLPLLVERAEATAVVTPPNSVEGEGRVILVVEDDPAVRFALIDLLQSWHYHTYEATNGLEALALLAQSEAPIDLIISDVVMPKMGGKTMFHTLRADNQQTPIILLSGYPQDIDLEELYAAGLSALLTKPVDLEQLAQAIAHALRSED